MNEILVRRIDQGCEGVTDLANVIHHLNVVAGWWKDLKTGAEFACVGQQNLHNSSAPQRNPAEMIALMHSELSEGLEGVRKNLMDDKLPTRKMEEVEMADCIIRILDYCGGRGLDVGGAIAEKLAYNATREDHKIEARQLEGGKSI